MKSIWIVAANVAEFGRVYLTEYAAINRTEALQKILARARSEGFAGSAQQRIDELGWEVVQVRIEEIPDA
jgi:hypothetical protein